MFKAWLRELPTEILRKAVQDKIATECHGAREVPQLLRDELSSLPPWNYYLLFATTCHLSLLIACAEKNKMISASASSPLYGLKLSKTRSQQSAVAWLRGLPTEILPKAVQDKIATESQRSGRKIDGSRYAHLAIDSLHFGGQLYQVLEMPHASEHRPILSIGWSISFVLESALADALDTLNRVANERHEFRKQ